MMPDDPRHGTYAGTLAHRRDKSDACLPCQLAGRRYVKTVKMRLDRGIRNRVPLGQRAWDILTHVGPTPVAEQTGLWRNNLYRAQRRGPDAVVLRATRDAILRVQGPTAAGVQRRIRALTTLGHTIEVIAAASGVHRDRIAVIARSDQAPNVRARAAQGVAAAYDALRDHEAPRTRETVRRRTVSERRGWLPPSAWDDIDDPTEDPLATIDPDYVDEVVVERLMAGLRMPSTKAEKFEAMRRWLASGRSQRSLCTIHGWYEGRYVERRDGAA
jgi:hypothetical protein